MKVFKKIGLGIISLGLISTFYIPEAKANFTLFEFEFPSSVPVLGGRTYALKKVSSLNFSNDGKFLMKRVGSGNTFCKQHIYTPSQLDKFVDCVASKLGSDLLESPIRAVLQNL